MDFSEPPEFVDLAAKTSAFIESRVVPLEADQRWTAHGPTEDLRHELNGLARTAGLFAPHAPKAYGGLGLGPLGCSFVFEAAGYSILGPVALHCAAPDEGNTHLLDVVATETQKETYLKPLSLGARSCFCMTEPDGAGSDPSQLRTTATWNGETYVIDGRKWLITGAQGAEFCIIMARMSGGPEDGRATMFLSSMDATGIVLERQMDTLDSSFAGGHWVVSFQGLEVPPEAILGTVGEGFAHAQVRLAPARLTHCMRWLGAARRAHDVARDYAASRLAFGQVIGEHEGVGFMLADNEMDIHLSRLVIRHTAWLLEHGNIATTESSMAKVICSEAIWRIVDRSMQILGGAGITREHPVERIFRDVRGFRIYDGPSEVHRWSLARKSLKQAQGGVAT